MARTIGAQSFALMDGRPAQPAEGVRPIKPRTGEDDGRSRLIGQRAAATRIETVAHAADAAAAVVLEDAYIALVGTLADIVDAFDVTHVGCLVMDVKVSLKAVLVAGASNVEVRAVWTVRQEAQ